MARLFKRAPWRAPANRSIQGKFIPGKTSTNVTLALTGASSTLSAGTLVANVAYAATGSSATVSAGTLKSAVSYALSGQAVTASAGTVVANISKALSGQSVTASAGTLVAAASYALSGQAATASAGTLLNNVAYGLTGSSATVSDGTVTAVGGDAGNVTKALTGEAATASAGTLVANVSYSATGQAATLSAGTLTNSPSYGLSGQGSTVSAGTVVGNVAYGLTGSEITASAGTVTVASSDVTVALTGQQITLSQGDLTSVGGNPAGMHGGGIPDRLRRRDKPRKVLVTIDGEDFEVRNEEEAVALLEKASQEAATLANAQAERVVALRQKRANRYGDLNTSPIKLDVPQIEVTQTDSERSLTDLIARFQEEINREYKEAAEKAEIALLLRNKVELDNDEATALLLLM